MKPLRWAKRLSWPASFRPELIGLILAAVVTRLWNLFTPDAVVFDEVYFKAFAAHYLDHRYYFDIHPPLGKLMLAGLAHLLGLQPDAMLSGTALDLRLLPAIAGILLVPLVWGILRRLGASRPFAFLGAAAVLLDNALTTESRFILMDSTLLLFGLGTLYCYLRARDAARAGQRWVWLVLAATSAGAAASIKWTGLTALALIGLVWLWDQRGHITWRRRLAELAVLVFVPLFIYAGAFWLHFQLLPNSGDGDVFMSQQFQATLIGNPGYDPARHLSFTEKFLQLNQEMYHANKTLTASHPYGSRWYTWPLEQRPIYYWEGDALPDGRQGNIYLLGNPVVWWGIWAALIGGFIYGYVKRRKLRPATVAALSITGIAYIINLLPFVAVPRVMFLYHYFFSFIFSLLAAVLLWNDLVATGNARQAAHSRRLYVFGAVLLAVLAGFLYFAPLTYGTPLSPDGLQARMWLHSWR